MNIRKKFVFQQAMSIKSEAKTKNHGVAGWKVGQTCHRNNCSHAKKYNKNIETLLAKQTFSLLIWDRQLKFIRWKGQCPFALLQHTEKFWNGFFQTFQAGLLFFSGGEEEEELKKSNPAWNVWKKPFQNFSVCCSKANGHWPFYLISPYFSALRQLALVNQ